MIECALITPPVGLNIYVLQAIGKAKMSEIAKGVIPFVIIMLFTVFVVYLFPDLASSKSITSFPLVWPHFFGHF